MTEVNERGKPLVDDPQRLENVSAIGYETAFLRATGRHPTLYKTGIVDLIGGRTPRLLDVTRGRSGIVLGGLVDRPGRNMAGRAVTPPH